MEVSHSSEDSKVRTGFILLIKRLWPHFLIYNSYGFTVAVLYINIVYIAGIMWPSDIPFAFELHASDHVIAMPRSTPNEKKYELLKPKLYFF